MSREAVSLAAQSNTQTSRGKRPEEGLVAGRPEIAGRRRPACAFGARAAVMTAAAAMLEAVAALGALAVLETATAGLRLPAGDEGRQAIDIAFGWLRLWLRLRAILAELLFALVRLLARRIRLLLLRRLRCETGLGAERVVLAFAVLTSVVADVAVLALLLILLRLVLPELFLGGGDQAEIMLGVLIVVLGGHRIAGRARVARQLHVFFRDVGCGS